MFLFALTGFIGKQALLRATGALALLATDFFDARAFRFHKALFHFLDFVEQKPTCEKTVHRLISRDLTFHAQAGGTVKQHDAG